MSSVFCLRDSRFRLSLPSFTVKGAATAVFLSRFVLVDLRIWTLRFPLEMSMLFFPRSSLLLLLPERGAVSPFYLSLRFVL